MRTGWKILGGTGIASVFAIAIVVGRSSVVRGDTTSDTTTAPIPAPSTGPLGGYHPANEPYSLGPHTIAYEQLSVVDKAAVDLIQETIETSQPASYSAAVVESANFLRQQVEAEIAARNVGLIGTEGDGVVP